jgi:hypothetical protein
MNGNYEHDVTERLRAALEELIPTNLIIKRLKEGLSANRVQHKLLQRRLIEITTPDYCVRQRYLRLIRQTGLYEPTAAEIEATQPPKGTRGKRTRSIRKPPKKR